MDENGDYLLERYTFTYVGSGRELLAHADENRTLRTPVVILANPEFDGEPPEETPMPESYPTRSGPRSLLERPLPITRRP